MHLPSFRFTAAYFSRCLEEVRNGYPVGNEEIEEAPIDTGFVSSVGAVMALGASCSTQAKKAWFCAECGIGFRSRINRKSHMRRMHEMRRPRVRPRPDCGQQFCYPSEVKKHFEIQFEETDCKCTFVGSEKAFSDDSNRRRHEREVQVHIPRVQ